MNNVQIINVAPSIPEPLAFLETLARNAWWCWNQEALSLFRRIGPSAWRHSGQNPLIFLREVPQTTLEAIADDPGFLKQLAKLQRWFEESTAPDAKVKHGLVAYLKGVCFRGRRHWRDGDRGESGSGGREGRKKAEI